MLICDKEDDKSIDFPELFSGHLYKNAKGDLYLCASDWRLYHVQDGLVWSSAVGGYGTYPFVGGPWTDVTTQYCIKKIG